MLCNLHLLGFRKKTFFAHIKANGWCLFGGEKLAEICKNVGYRAFQTKSVTICPTLPYLECIRYQLNDDEIRLLSLHIFVILDYDKLNNLKSVNIFFSNTKVHISIWLTQITANKLQINILRNYYHIKMLDRSKDYYSFPTWLLSITLTENIIDSWLL